MEPTPGSLWRNVHTGEVIEVDSFDGAYAVVCGDFHDLGRGVTHSGKPNAFLVHPSHFGTTYVPQEKPKPHLSWEVKGPFGKCSYPDCGAPADIVLSGQRKVCDRHDPFNTPH